MDSSFADRTSASLLARLRQETTDQAAWAEFVRRYSRQIYRWCSAWHLQDADAQDVTQAVLVKLAGQLRTFSYDPAQSFRAYLKTITHRAWCNFLDSRRRREAGSGDTAVLTLLQTVAARDDLVAHLREQFDRELLDEAMARVQRRVAAHTWEAFCRTALEGLSGAAVAEQLGLTVAVVFKAKSKVQKMLQEEIRRLEQP